MLNIATVIMFLLISTNNSVVDNSGEHYKEEITEFRSIKEQVVEENTTYLAQSRTVAPEVKASARVVDIDSESETDFLGKIKELGIRLHPGSEFKADGAAPNERSLKRCGEIVFKTLDNMPEVAIDKLEHLTLYFSNSGRRGLGGGDTIILRCSNMDDHELIGVLIHEVGHIYDTGVMEGSLWSGESEFMDGKVPVYNDDKSLQFYQISFLDEQTKKPETTTLDFVSGYAASDPFEDFAESFTYYILHGENFRQLAKFNPVLSSKYNFLKYQVFNGDEFKGLSTESADLLHRNYDVTVLGFDYKNYLEI